MCRLIAVPIAWSRQCSEDRSSLPVLISDLAAVSGDTHHVLDLESTEAELVVQRLKQTTMPSSRTSLLDGLKSGAS
jgi:hypothetical protein